LNSHLPTCQFFCLRFWEDVKHRFSVMTMFFLCLTFWEGMYERERERERVQWWW
jgi:hypothetical protein